MGIPANEMTATRVLKRGDRAVAKKLRAYQLRITDGAGATRTQRVDRRVIRLGSHGDNDVVLEDRAVSRLHCEIVADDLGFRVHDLGSRNGTWLDDHRAIDAYLRDGSRVRLGETLIVFELLADETDLPLSGADRFGPLVGRSAAMREVFGLLERVAPSDATVLIEGESGTGKELVARALHEASARGGGPYVVFDCAAVSPQLLESELFGHEKGAFTGATAQRAGAVEDAERGTLFLDEVGELPLDLQPKLLRLLEQREYKRVGSNRRVQVDVRVVAATNRDLATEVNRGTFREDLYYRLAVVGVVVPPLRERPEDVPLLLATFVDARVREPGRAQAIVEGISGETWHELQRHPWPGNVRELRNVVDRMIALGEEPAPAPGPATSGSASAGSLGALARDAGTAVTVDLTRPMMEQKRELVARFEEAYLTGIVDAHGGNLTHAAKAAGVERMYFKQLLRKYRP